ncbi:hypothetical protein [Rhodococcus wratislaviensis]|uniref:hypothetical protein n=1 Tax=Rhodococcus wratislaviensis TaxID=44752 RepID=UPI00351379FA
MTDLDALALRFDMAALGIVSLKAEGDGRDVDAFNLRLYWTLGEGAAKIAWGFQGDHGRCTVALGKHIGEDRARRVCASYHKDLFGVAPSNEVNAEKPPVPDDWDFDADSPEDALKPVEDDEA